MRKKLMLAAVCAAALMTGAVQAEPEHGLPESVRDGSYVTESKTTTADGQVYKRRVEQKVQDGKTERRVQLTRPDGKTATETVTIVKDAKTGKVSRKLEGSGFDGKTYTRESSGERSCRKHHRQKHGYHKGRSGDERL